MSKKQKNTKKYDIRYKIRMVVDIEGDIEETKDLREDTGIEPFIQWAAEDIEQALDGVCEIVSVKKVELEDITGEE